VNEIGRHSSHTLRINSTAYNNNKQSKIVSQKEEEEICQCVSLFLFCQTIFAKNTAQYSFPIFLRA
jgi:hypothetical protein